MLRLQSFKHTQLRPWISHSAIRSQYIHQQRNSPKGRFPSHEFPAHASQSIIDARERWVARGKNNSDVWKSREDVLRRYWANKISRDQSAPRHKNSANCLECQHDDPYAISTLLQLKEDYVVYQNSWKKIASAAYDLWRAFSLSDPAEVRKDAQVFAQCCTLAWCNHDATRPDAEMAFNYAQCVGDMVSKPQITAKHFRRFSLVSYPFRRVIFLQDTIGFINLECKRFPEGLVLEATHRMGKIGCESTYYHLLHTHTRVLEKMSQFDIQLRLGMGKTNAAYQKTIYDPYDCVYLQLRRLWIKISNQFHRCETATSTFWNMRYRDSQVVYLHAYHLDQARMALQAYNLVTSKCKYAFRDLFERYLVAVGARLGLDRSKGVHAQAHLSTERDDLINSEEYKTEREMLFEASYLIRVILLHLEEYIAVIDELRSIFYTEFADIDSGEEASNEEELSGQDTPAPQSVSCRYPRRWRIARKVTDMAMVQRACRLTLKRGKSRDPEVEFVKIQVRRQIRWFEKFLGVVNDLLDESAKELRAMENAERRARFYEGASRYLE